MAKFEPALAYTLKHEGGWSDDPADPGGATNYGITLKTAQRHGIATKEALKTITPEQVAAIYKADYWRFDGINNQRVATKLFDMAVNMGLETAIKLSQRAINANGIVLTIDGRLGSVTLAALNNCELVLLMQLLCAVSADYYRKIVAKRPASQKFLKGWLKRAAEVPNA
jgi:lysozyme family protein